MDDWRYVRYAECKAWQPRDAREGTDITAVMRDPSTLYRFPFPDEDVFLVDGKFNWGVINERNMFRSVKFKYETDSDFKHGEKVVNLTPDGSGYQVNIWIPCPVVKPYPLKTSIGGAVALCNIWGDRYDEQGFGRTIFRCAWCEAPFSVGVENIDQVRLALIAMKPRDQWDNPDSWWDKVAHRIMPNQQQDGFGAISSMCGT